VPDSAPSDTGRIRPPKQAVYAAIAMLVLAGLTLVGVAAYWAQAPDPWTWRGLVALATIPFSVLCAGLLWRAPTRENAGAALLVIAFSVARVGFPADWTRATYVLIAITLAIAAPVVWAARTLPP
jgi:hypothetical protein